MDYVWHEFFTTFRRIAAAFLGLMLLVAFWADRPGAAASVPVVSEYSLLRAAGATSGQTALAPPERTSLISAIRRPWLAFYTVTSAPPLARGPLTDTTTDATRGNWLVFTLARMTPTPSDASGEILSGFCAKMRRTSPRPRLAPRD